MEWIKRVPEKTVLRSDSLIEKLAKIHGVDDLEEFLNPSQKSEHSYQLLDNIQEACKYILHAINSGLKIYIFADIDADGITSTAIMYNYLKQFTEFVEYFHAQRSDGHGLEQAGEKLIPEDAQLLIVVDSSTSDAEACKRISEKGLPIVIIDHHPPENPNDYAIIVNNQTSPNYPNKNISGAGMCLKVIQALDEYLCSDSPEDMYDLAGVGIYADAMDVREPENRYIIDRALRNMRNLGLLSLLKVAKQDVKRLNSSSIGFTIAPMLNGASRMGKMEVVLELLTTDDPERALELAKQVSKMNDERKEKSAYYFDKFVGSVNQDDEVLIVIDKEVNKDFAGLIAGEFVGKFNKPTLVMTPNEKGNYFQGSFRSPSDVPFKDILAEMHKEDGKGIVSFVAGHQGAGGAGLGAWNLEKFVQATNTKIRGMGRKNVASVQYDLELDAGDITLDLVEEIMQFTRISGRGIPEAKFKVTGLFAVDKKLMGKKKNTVKIMCDGIDLLKFRTDEQYFEDAPVFDDLEAVGSLNINRWFNFQKREEIVTVQMFLEDYQIQG